MKGYGIASWLRKEEYRNYFVSANYQPEDDGTASIRLNKFANNLTNGWDCVARAPLTNLCKCISVGNYSGEMGIVAGGMDDGSIMLWDIDTMYKEGDTITDNSESSSIISNQLVHEGSSVNAIQFNPSIQNLLASGGSEVLIQDIQHNIEEPTLFTPGQPNFHEGATVTAISWNKVVPFILASAGNDGSVVVWDLKNTKAIFNLKDPNLVSYSYDPFSETKEEQVTANYKIIWSLKVPTQFLICNDLETMSMWDLRKSDTPLFSLADTLTSQAIGSAWCPHDESIFATSFNSGKVSFFHSDTGSIVSEYQDGKKYINMEWSPFHKGVLLGYNTDNETKIIDFSLSSTSKSDQSDNLYAPKWLSRPLGSRFGFGGQLVTFSSNKGEPLKLYQTQSAPELCSKIEKLEESRSTQPLSTIIDSFIEKSSKIEIEKMEWVTIRSLCTKNFDSLFSLFDINKQDVINEAEKLTGKKKMKQKTQKSDLQLKSQNNELSNLDANQANEFFANFAENHEKKLEEEDKKIEVKSGPKITQEVISRNSNWDESGEGVIKRSLLIGNIEGASECALKCGRTTEALLLALASGNEAFIEQIKAEYFTQNKDSFVSTVIKGIVNKETEEMIMDLAQTNWKEALAYSLSFTPKAKFKELVERIAEQLYQKKRDINSAIICYMISHNIDKLSELWKIRADAIIKKNPQHKFVVYSNFAEKITFYRMATGITQNTEQCDSVIGELAEILIQEGLFEIAYRYLDLNGCISEKCERIRERIFYNNEIKFGNEFDRPKFRHLVHQLPRITPKVVNKNKTNDANFGRKPQQMLNPQQTNQLNSPYNQRNQQTNYNQPISPSEKPNLQAAPVSRSTELNKKSNFGYSQTHPSLLSEFETNNSESSSKRVKPAKQKQPNAAPTNTHVFDPSKVSNVPPPPKQHIKQIVTDPPIYNPPPTQVQYDQYQNQIQAPAYEIAPPPYPMAHTQPVMSQPPAPVIAVTNVKPPTAQMKPKAPMAVQRQPPPRMNTAAEVQQPPMGGLIQNQPQSQMMIPPTTTPGRGRGAPMGRGRGMPPSARGGHIAPAPSEGMSHMHAPPPMPQVGAPIGMSPSSSMQMATPPAPASMMAAPPPPKLIVRRPKPGIQ